MKKTSPKQDRKHIDLFSGIGGFAYAIDQIYGKENIKHTFVEIDPFCQAILKKHWPEAEIHGDIRTFADTRGKESRRLSGGKREEVAEIGGDGIFILTGGFPCQPFSQAGRRKGTSDDRFLWPEMFRVIRNTKPTWVIAENVRGLLTINEGLVFEQVCLDLEGEGYEVQPLVIPAVAVNAPHRRDRIWFVARHTEYDGFDGAENSESHTPRINRNKKGTNQVRKSERANSLWRDAPYTSSKRPNRGQADRPRQQSSVSRQDIQDHAPDWDANWLEVATALCTLDDGLPNGLSRPKGWRNAAIKACGNAIVPQVAMQILQAIKEIT